MGLGTALVGQLHALDACRHVERLAAMCCVLPTPDEPYLKSPGLAFISAMSSATVLAGTEVPTTSTLGTLTTRPIWVRSLIASKLSLRRCGAMA